MFFIWPTTESVVTALWLFCGPSSLLIDLARHRAGWPWSESLSHFFFVYFAFPFAYYSSSFTVQQEWITFCAAVKLSSSTTAVYISNGKKLHTIGLLQQQWITLYFSPLFCVLRSSSYVSVLPNNNPAVENTCQSVRPQQQESWSRCLLASVRAQ